MCTLTWQFNESKTGYYLVFNRDELKTRQKALPPQLQQSDEGVSYIAPTDADAGGTWIAVNQFGLTVCLLNYYQAKEPQDKDNLISRGKVVQRLGVCRTIDEASAMLAAMDLSRYRGFQLVFLHEHVACYRWDTENLQAVTPTMPMTSSSEAADEVCAFRKMLFEQYHCEDSLQNLLDYHASHALPEDQVPSPGGGQFSVCMHRENAQTVSQTIVQVNDQEISMAYVDGSPCRTEASSHTVLQRLRAA